MAVTCSEHTRNLRKCLHMKGNTRVDTQERACAKTIFTVGRVGRKLLRCLCT